MKNKYNTVGSPRDLFTLQFFGFTAEQQNEFAELKKFASLYSLLREFGNVDVQFIRAVREAGMGGIAMKPTPNGIVIEITGVLPVDYDPEFWDQIFQHALGMGKEVFQAKNARILYQRILLTDIITL